MYSYLRRSVVEVLANVGASNFAKCKKSPLIACLVVRNFRPNNCRTCDLFDFYDATDGNAKCVEGDFELLRQRIIDTVDSYCAAPDKHCDYEVRVKHSQSHRQLS